MGAKYLGVGRLFYGRGSVPAIVAVVILAGCSGSPPPETKSETPASPAHFKVDPSTAGTITGKVTYAGPKPAPRRIKMDEEAACVRMHKGGLVDEELIVNANGTLSNVFVYIQNGLQGKVFETPTGVETIDQKGCRFAPHVLGIRTGQTLKVLNSDPVSHNIHPMPAINREWNQGQAPGAAPLEREFARPEIMVPVKCNVHSWMRSYIGVLDHPYFAVTGPDGTFELKNVPPGEFTIEAWHEKLGKQQQKVTLPASARGVAEFSYQAR